jgi:hypothetical protein
MDITTSEARQFAHAAGALAALAHARGDDATLEEASLLLTEFTRDLLSEADLDIAFGAGYEQATSLGL